MKFIFPISCAQRMRYLFLWFGVAIALQGTYVVAQPASEFARSAELATPAGSSVARAVIPASLWAGLYSPTAADLRVVNAAGDFLPFPLVTVQAQAHKTPESEVLQAYPLFAAESVLQETPALRIIDGASQRGVEISATTALNSTCKNQNCEGFFMMTATFNGKSTQCKYWPIYLLTRWGMCL